MRRTPPRPSDAELRIRLFITMLAQRREKKFHLPLEMAFRLHAHEEGMVHFGTTSGSWTIAPPVYSTNM